jgi:ribosomal protein S18 acetylase RimI-like enzyme
MIRKIKPSDNMQEYLQCVEDLMQKETDTVANMKQKIIFAKESVYDVYVYELEGKIVGTISIIFEQKLRYKHPKVYIEDVGVKKSYRGRGIAKEMINFCLGVAKKKQAYKIVLSCRDDLVGFCEKIGFEKKDNFMIKE